MPTGVEGQCAVVTGATSGIGRAAAMAFGRAGAPVAVNHRSDPDAAEKVVAASKGGDDMMMRSLAQEVSGEKIRVNTIAPGAIKTSTNRESRESDGTERALLKLIPYGRVGDVEDIAKAAVWLASDESDYVVGTTLYIDGGMTLYPGFHGDG